MYSPMYCKRKVICIIFLSVSATLLRLYIPLPSICIYLLFYLTILLCFHCNPKLGFVTTLIAFFLSQALLIVASSIGAMVLYPFFRNESLPPKLILYFFTGILLYYSAHLPFQIKRFQKGISFLYNNNLINSGVWIGIITVCLLSFGQQMYSPFLDSQLIVLIILILLAAILLFFLWQRCIRQYYLTKLRNLELESLRQELEEKDAMIERLMKNNEEQAQMIHKDNKLVPAMLSAVTDYLLAAESGGDTVHTGEALAAELKGLADERLTILTTAFETAATLPLLHCASVDAMLSYMQKRALQEKITFEVKLHPGFAGRIGTDITEADLSHLLSDLLENAVIATKHAKNRRILVHLGILYDAAVAEVSDSGQAFEPSVYQDFGLQKHSTHLDSGGSGIGLMDIWKLKKKYAASLHIYEYADEAAPYTKKISVVFDHRKHYLIRTCRPEELVKMQARSDLYILPLNDSKE